MTEHLIAGDITPEEAEAVLAVMRATTADTFTVRQMNTWDDQRMGVFMRGDVPFDLVTLHSMVATGAITLLRLQKYTEQHTAPVFISK